MVWAPNPRSPVSLSTFFRNISHEVQDSYAFARDYWREHTLGQGYAEVVRETSQSLHDQVRNSNILIQSVAGASLGVAQLLGGIPIGLVQWSVDVARETRQRGPVAGAIEFVRNPIAGMVEGGRSVYQAFGRWADGSLLEMDSFRIAQEVTTVLGTGGMLLMGARDMGRGGRNLGRQLSQVRVRPSGMMPAFSLAGAGGRSTIAGAGIEISLPALNPRPLGQGLLMMSSQRPPANAEPPPPLLPLNGRSPQEAAQFATDYQRFLPEVLQSPIAGLHPAVQRRILEMIERSDNDGFEHEFLALEMADGTVLQSDILNSASPFQVNNPRGKNRALQLLLDSANQHLSQGNPPRRIHAYHTHPQRGKVHGDGHAFTETNSIDCRAWENYLSTFAQRLGRLGFRGQLEISGGALPARSGLSDANPYVANFRRSLEVAGE